MKKQDIKERLKLNYEILKERLKEYDININTVKVKWDDFNLTFHSLEFNTKLSSKKFRALASNLGHDWEVKKKNQERVTIWEHDPGPEGVNFVDFDPKRIESQSSIESLISGIQNVTLSEVASSRPLSPVSPSEIRVR